MTKNYFDNNKIKTSLKLWLDKEYEIISNTDSLSEMFKNEYFKTINQVIDKKNKEKFLKDNFFNKSTYIIHKFSNNPWITQAEILKNLDISIEELYSLNLILRNSEIFQHIILKEGIGNKYWNSIIPFAKNANLVLEKKISLPKRIVIFPGVSCMFFCGFCGRNQSAKYPMKSVENGTEVFKKLFNETGNNTLYSIGGGLEPTTNPQLGEIINSAISNKIRMPLITNGYSLTENYIKKKSRHLGSRFFKIIVIWNR